LSTTNTGRYKEKLPEGLIEVQKDLPLRIESVDVKGKFMWWTLVGKDKTWHLWSTYGMSGNGQRP